MTKKRENIKIRGAEKPDFERIIRLLKEEGVFNEGIDTPGVYQRTIKNNPVSILVAERTKKRRILKDAKTILGVVFTRYDPEEHYRGADVYHRAVSQRYLGREELGKRLLSEAEKRLNRLNNPPTKTVCRPYS